MLGAGTSWSGRRNSPWGPWPSSLLVGGSAEGTTSIGTSLFMKTHTRFDFWITPVIVLGLLVVSTMLMLRMASSELGWDEADYAASINRPWRSLWSQSDYERHAHGPLAMYLAKAGQTALPATLFTPEERLRLPIALLSSISIGLVYWALRSVFDVSQAGSIVGSCLLLFSDIRLQETEVIGPHGLTLLFTLLLVVLGWRWRYTPTAFTATSLGVIVGMAGITMTYVVPVTLACGAAMLLAGGAWLKADRMQLRISWYVIWFIAVAAFVGVVLWPPSVLHMAFVHDFLFYMRYRSVPFPGLVGTQIVQRIPRTAFFYWFAHLDAPIVISAGLVLTLSYTKRLKERSFTDKHVYFASLLVILLGVALSAHIAGARNLVQFIGVLCLATGALFDEVAGRLPSWRPWAAAVIVVSCGLNLLWLSWISDHVPNPPMSGYRAFVTERRDFLDEATSAIVYGGPILKFYANQRATKIAWNEEELPWTTMADAAIPSNVKCALIPEFVWRYMPKDQPVPRLIDGKWRIAWEFKAPHCWGLRLYERP